MKTPKLKPLLTNKMNPKSKELIHELKHHLPFAIIATAVAMALSAVLILTGTEISEGIFETMHPLHIITSSLVSSAIFYKYKKSISGAILVGMVSSIIIGSLSDIIFPYIGGNLLGLQTAFHLPLIETPGIILSSSLIGSIIGISSKITKIPHFIHVLVSAFASLFYLLAFGGAVTLLSFAIAFAIVIVSVVIPCCISDIIFPFFFLGEKIKHCNC